MTLRWILLSAGVVLLAGIYFWGRRNRRAGPDDGPTISAGRGAPVLGGHTQIPQLDDSVVVRGRVVELPVSITSGDSTINTDGLPPMHAQTSPSLVRATPSMSATRDAVPESTGDDFRVDTSDSGWSSSTMTPRDPPVLSAHESNVSTRVASKNLSTTLHERTAIPPPKKATASRKIVALRLSAGSDRVEGARLKQLLEAAGLRHGKYGIYHRLHTDGSVLFSVASMVEPGTFDPFAMSGVQFPGVTIFTQLPGVIDGSEMFAQMLACARELEQGMSGLLQDERGLPLTEQRAQKLTEDVADFAHLLGQI